MLLLYAVHFYPRTCTPHVLAWTHASHDNSVSPCMVYILPSLITLFFFVISVPLIPLLLDIPVAALAELGKNSRVPLSKNAVRMLLDRAVR